MALADLISEYMRQGTANPLPSIPVPVPQPQQVQQARPIINPDNPGRIVSINGRPVDVANAAFNRISSPAGPGGDVMSQLQAGFRDAGRPDLANAVNTPEFQTWIKAESGGIPTRVSAANNQGKPNGGLFQFWYGHPWAQQYFQGNQFVASPYQQAQLAVKYFPHLSPQAISGYASQIRGGRYKGWG